MRLLSAATLAAVALAACTARPRWCRTSDPPTGAEEAPTVDEVAAKIDALFADFDRADAPGACVALYLRGVPAIIRCWGLADLERRVPITPETNFRLASITKQFTATCILLLRERGALALDDPAGRFLPELGALGERVTIRHLLTHTSGVIAYEDIIPPGQTEQLLDRDVLTLVSARPETLFEPGTRQRYSNTGYALLALIVERASGERFADFLRRHIFEPLGMDNTVAFEEGRSTVPHRAFGHTERHGRWELTDQSLTSAVLGDGGIYCSAIDYGRWEEALLTARLLPHAVLEEMVTNHRLPDGTPTEYGFGWRIEVRHGQRIIHHNGGTVGFAHGVRRVPGRQMTLLVLSNRSAPTARERGDQLLDWLLTRPPIRRGPAQS